MSKIRFHNMSKLYFVTSCVAFLLVSVLIGCRNNNFMVEETSSPTLGINLVASTSHSKTIGLDLFQETNQFYKQGTLSPEIIRSHIVGLKTDSLQKIIDTLDRSDKKITVELILFDDANYSAILGLSNNTKVENSVIFEGVLEEIPNSQVLFVVDKNGILAGNISFPGAIYQIRFLESDLYRINQIDQAKFPNPEEPIMK